MGLGVTWDNINAPEAIWCICVFFGIILNAIFTYHSARLLRHVHAINAYPSMIEAAKLRLFVDAARVGGQLLFLYPAWLAITHPNPPLTRQAWAFSLCFIGVEVSLVLLAAVTAAWYRRIIRYRLRERGRL